jgi:transposase
MHRAELRRVGAGAQRHDGGRLLPDQPQVPGPLPGIPLPQSLEERSKGARLLCDFLRLDRDELHPMAPSDPASARRANLTEHRRTLIDERTRQLNRLRAELKVYVPHVLQWFEETNTPVLWKFLLTGPSLQQAQRARPKTVLAFLCASQVRRGKPVKQFPEDIGKAVALHQDEVVLEASSLLVQSLCHLLLSLQAAIQMYDGLLEETVASHPERWLVQGLPGAGPQLQPRLLAAFGADRARYPRCEILAQLAGIAPVCETVAPSIGFASGGPPRPSCAKAFTSLPRIPWQSRRGPGTAARPPRPEGSLIM